ncbi:hypothetical protein CYMTET_38221 [Cymbomonas tetramitiformis]|uniref:Cyclic nucleotide-binding domain-containing protein n=1 Tax=Cymbomonas tetramitiformis TaxID=36881 RepID=A0AAE0CCC5_9CHLO|nr:hypothetical protein CYMTET_38221 [Cymbomonas tetramitiformis]
MAAGCRQRALDSMDGAELRLMRRWGQAPRAGCKGSLGVWATVPARLEYVRVMANSLYFTCAEVCTVIAAFPERTWQRQEALLLLFAAITDLQNFQLVQQALQPADWNRLLERLQMMRCFSALTLTGRYTLNLAHQVDLAVAHWLQVAFRKEMAEGLCSLHATGNEGVTCWRNVYLDGILKMWEDFTTWEIPTKGWLVLDYISMRCPPAEVRPVDDQALQDILQAINEPVAKHIPTFTEEQALRNSLRVQGYTAIIDHVETEEHTWESSIVGTNSNLLEDRDCHPFDTPEEVIVNAERRADLYLKFTKELRKWYFRDVLWKHLDLILPEVGLGTSAAQLKEVVTSKIQTRDVEAGKDLMTAGEMVGPFYFIELGMVDMLWQGKRMYTAEAGEVIGELFVLSGWERHLYTARARTDLKVVSLSRYDMESLYKTGERKRNQLRIAQFAKKQLVSDQMAMEAAYAVLYPVATKAATPTKSGRKSAKKTAKGGETEGAAGAKLVSLRCLFTNMPVPKLTPELFYQRRAARYFIRKFLLTHRVTLEQAMQIIECPALTMPGDMADAVVIIYGRLRREDRRKFHTLLMMLSAVEQLLVMRRLGVATVVDRRNPSGVQYHLQLQDASQRDIARRLSKLAQRGAIGEDERCWINVFINGNPLQEHPFYPRHLQKKMEAEEKLARKEDRKPKSLVTPQMKDAAFWAGVRHYIEKGQEIEEQKDTKAQMILEFRHTSSEEQLQRASSIMLQARWKSKYYSQCFQKMRRDLASSKISRCWRGYCVRKYIFADMLAEHRRKELARVTNLKNAEKRNRLRGLPANSGIS